MLPTLDVLLTILHIGIILINLLGWAWEKMRKLHLVIVIATSASWFLLGIWYGWGYCFLTDWHWDVKRALGETRLPNSFIKYAVDKITGRDWNAAQVDQYTLYIFLAVIALTIYVNFPRKKKKS